MSEESAHYGKMFHGKKITFKFTEDMVLTPEQIAEYIHEEFTPYTNMRLEEGKKHLAELIQRYADYFALRVRNRVMDKILTIESDKPAGIYTDPTK